MLKRMLDQSEVLEQLRAVQAQCLRDRQRSKAVREAADSGKRGQTSVEFTFEQAVTLDAPVRQQKRSSAIVRPQGRQKDSEAPILTSLPLERNSRLLSPG